MAGMKRSCDYYFTLLDLFPFPVNVYYLKDYQYKKSIFGTIMTLMMMAITLIYLETLVKHLQDPDYQKIMQTDYHKNMTFEQEINIEDENFRFFTVLRKPGKVNKDILNDIDRYINI